MTRRPLAPRWQYLGAMLRRKRARLLPLADPWVRHVRELQAQHNRGVGLFANVRWGGAPDA